MVEQTHHQTIQRSWEAWSAIPSSDGLYIYPSPGAAYLVEGCHRYRISRLPPPVLGDRRRVVITVEGVGLRALARIVVWADCWGLALDELESDGAIRSDYRAPIEVDRYPLEGATIVRAPHG